MISLCKTVIVSGLVQGVFYRDWTVKTATSLGLRGWVRNRSDGTVEALLCGRQETITTMIGHMHTGPDRARVDHVAIADTHETAPNDFVKQPTT